MNEMDINSFVGRKLTTDEYATAENYRRLKIKEIENLTFDSGSDYLLLKWGGMKGYDYKNNPKGQELIQELYDIGISASVILQNNTERQKEILVELIEITDGYIVSDWSGDYFTKAEAKKYILEK